MDETALTRPEEPDRPRVVEEAEEVLGTYAWQLTGAGALAASAWAAAAVTGSPLPLLWLVAALVALLALYVSPVTREPRLARDVLRRWDDRRVDRALESGGITDDPRLQVAESMADRIVRHPSVEPRVRTATAALLHRLRRLLSDIRRVEYLAQARLTMGRGEDSRSISDLQDHLDARIAEVLGQLASLHSTVVLRDAGSLGRVVEEVEDLVRALEAAQDVERLLLDAERG
jgi:hypothetical protein